MLDSTPSENESDEAIAADLKVAHQRIEALMREMSHEIRTPLTSILGFADVLLKFENETLSPSQERFVEIIRKNSQITLDRFSQYVTLGQMLLFREPTTAEEINLLALLHQIVVPSLEKSIPAELPNIRFERHYLGSILKLLLSISLPTAVQPLHLVATHQGAEVRIQLTLVPPAYFAPTSDLRLLATQNVLQRQGGRLSWQQEEEALIISISLSV